jgi:hypothetical protein
LTARRAVLLALRLLVVRTFSITSSRPALRAAEPPRDTVPDRMNRDYGYGVDA